MPGAALFGHYCLRLFIPNTGELVSLQYLSLCSFYFYFFGRGVSSLYRTHNTKVKLWGLDPTLTCMLSYINLSYGISPKTSYLLIYCSVFNIIKCRLILKQTLSTQASEKSVWLFSLFGFGRFLAMSLIFNALLAFHLHLASWLYFDCFYLASWLYFDCF